MVIEGLTIFSIFVVVFFVSTISKNTTVSLFLGMFFVIFSFMIIKIVPHLRHEHSEEFSFSHFVDVISGNEKMNLTCPVCKSKDISIFLTEDEASNVVIKCNTCKSGVEAVTINEAMKNWRVVTPESKIEDREEKDD